LSETHKNGVPLVTCKLSGKSDPFKIVAPTVRISTFGSVSNASVFIVTS